MWLGILGLFLAGLCAPASAVTVSGLYAADVPVASASADDLAEGYAAGLSKVFVRISGTRDVLSMDGVKPLLADAESLLLSYQVLRNESGESHLRMTFGAVGVNRALASVNAPVWGANRPLTLAWIAVEDRARALWLLRVGVASQPMPGNQRLNRLQATEGFRWPFRRKALVASGSCCLISGASLSAGYAARLQI
jgi:hypothetical protein